ncbi:Aspartic-type endopeptidase ctsD [Penicillium canariense]|uniref:Aspartic-type endopeptidase ctsD n=1 Tax=Penicillium canariense TaxID=189055 RepID=A0A9W9LU87_9EURO|nr:Aspartic-type endopeptidase ctsD [Penicillium canariense]KAJ5176300.1 Aspartic-type endopeptidase ctsD [Penicillium canariense]
MRFSPCLLIAGLSTGVHAFYPYELKVAASASISSRDSVQRRFFPWALVPDSSDDTSTDAKPLTLDIKKGSVRRDDTYSIVESNTPTLPNSAPLDQDGMDFSYFAVVEVGSQKEEMWLALDTGSPSSWVFSSSCTDSVCTSHHTFDTSASSSYISNSSTYSVGYGSGNVRGDLGQDSFSIADMQVTFSFGTATSATSTFSSYPIDGILGLGRSDTGGWDIPSFMDVVAEKGYLASNLVGFSLSRAKDNKKDGEVNFGTVDTTKFDGNISYTATSTDTWTIPMDEVYVNGQAAGLTSKSATIDSGTTYVLIPPSDAATLFALIPGSSMSGENYIIPCNSTATLELSFSGVKYSISPEDYIGATSTGGCVSTIVGHQSAGANDWLVGDVFLKNVYTVFDFDNGQIGFGTLATSNTTGNGTFVAPSVTATATTADSTTGSTSTASTASTASDTVIHTGAASRLSHGAGLSLLTALTSMLFV